MSGAQGSLCTGFRLFFFTSVRGIHEWLIEAVSVARVLQPTTQSQLRRKKGLICVLFLCVILQKLQEKTTSCQRPAHDRKRKFIKSDLALDTEGRQRAAGEVNFTAPKHLAKFNWFVATCAAKYRISITTQRPVMVLTSLCQRSETQIDLLLAAHVPTEPPPAYQPSLMKSVVSDTSPELCLCFFFFQTAFKPCSLLWFPPLLLHHLLQSSSRTSVSCRRLGWQKVSVSNLEQEKGGERWVKMDRL